MAARKVTIFTVIVAVALSLLVGVAGAKGYGVGDGTGPIGTHPQDGTGQQHRAPAAYVVDMPSATSVTVTLHGTQARDHLRLHDGTCDGTPDRDRDHDRLGSGDQLRTQDRDRTCW